MTFLLHVMRQYLNYVHDVIFNTVFKPMFLRLTRKSSCANGRAIPSSTQQILALPLSVQEGDTPILSWPRGRYPILSWPGSTPSSPDQKVPHHVLTRRYPIMSWPRYSPPLPKGPGTRYWGSHRKDMGPVQESVLGWRWGTPQPLWHKGKPMTLDMLMYYQLILQGPMLPCSCPSNGQWTDTHLWKQYLPHSQLYFTIRVSLLINIDVH